MQTNELAKIRVKEFLDRYNQENQEKETQALMSLYSLTREAAEKMYHDGLPHVVEAAVACGDLVLPDFDD